MNDKKLKHFAGLINKKKMTEKDDEELRKVIREDLESLYPEIRQYYAEYPESDVKQLLDHYVFDKYLFTKFADLHKSEVEKAHVIHLKKAEECLWIIQQKKLFDLQCKWRAKLIDLEGLSISWEFDHWSKNIHACPFLDPITHEEVDLLVEYLTSNSCHLDVDYYDHGDWQDYYDYKEHEDLPEWYEFYDLRMGTSGIFNLPDLRGEREEYYRNIYFQLRDAKQRENQGKSLPKEKIKRLEYLDKRVITDFVKKFECRENQSFYKNFLEFNKPEGFTDEDQGIHEYIEEIVLPYLHRTNELVPIQAHADWRIALMNAAEKHYRTRIAEAIPTAYEDYCFKVDNGLMNKEVDNRDYYLVDRVKEQILEARKHLGEPLDFNY